MLDLHAADAGKRFSSDDEAYVRCFLIKLKLMCVSY